MLHRHGAKGEKPRPATGEWNGLLHNLGLKRRNATARSNFTNDLDENRLILSYTLPLW